MNTNQFLNLILLFSMAVDDVIITSRNFYQNFLYRPLQKNKLIHNLFYLIFSYVCVYVCVSIDRRTNWNADDSTAVKKNIY